MVEKLLSGSGCCRMPAGAAWQSRALYGLHNAWNRDVTDRWTFRELGRVIRRVLAVPANPSFSTSMDGKLNKKKKKTDFLGQNLFPVSHGLILPSPARCHHCSRLERKLGVSEKSESQPVCFPSFSQCLTGGGYFHWNEHPLRTFLCIVEYQWALRIANELEMLEIGYWEFPVRLLARRK